MVNLDYSGQMCLTSLRLYMEKEKNITMLQLLKSLENMFSLLKCWKNFIHPINLRVIGLGLGVHCPK